MKRMLAIAAVAILASGCATTPEEDTWADQRDPFESINRDVWDFNEELDDAVLRPTAKAYSKVPQPIRTGLLNAVENLDEVSSIVNNALQGKAVDAGVSFWRFTINSSIGILGLFDVATEIGINRRQEGFGEVLAYYGVGDGPYLMLPAMGPTVPVDRGGDVVDGMYFPLDNLNGPTSVARWVIKGLEARIQVMDLEPMLEDSLDPYSFVKESYFQRWQDKVYDGNPPAPPEEEQLDEDFYDQF
ncbi:VacJ family lipoprotein [Pseudidiomarina sp.]|uniref:MlaA family lipoprotein n=1 Tax=Pseudidiomarina sp. TaxID=2081707 RepID=UPI003A984559